LAVTLIEKVGQVLPPLDAEMAEPLRRELLRHDIRLISGAGFTAIREVAGKATGVVLENGVTIEADLVILGLGVRPYNQLAAAASMASTPATSAAPPMSATSPSIGPRRSRRRPPPAARSKPAAPPGHSAATATTNCTP
jgi:NAD(P)H-nitrite reductase large subunit